MKMYLNVEQTAKLIELGFEKPSPKWVKDENGDYRVKTNDADYDIGELLSILPLTVGKNYDLHIESSLAKWYVAYYWIGNGGEYYIKYEFSACELIDALYMMILRLKEEGVI